MGTSSRVCSSTRRAAVRVLIALLLLPTAATGEPDWPSLDGEFYTYCPGCHWWGGDMPRRVAEYAAYGISGGQPQWGIRINVIDAYPGVMWTFVAQCVLIAPFGDEGGEGVSGQSRDHRKPPDESAPAWSGPGWGQFVCAAYGPSPASASAESFRAMAHQIALDGRGGKAIYHVDLPPGNPYGESVLDLLRWPSNAGFRLGREAIWVARDAGVGPDFTLERNRLSASFVSAQLSTELRYRFRLPDGSSIDYVIDMSRGEAEMDSQSAVSPGGVRIAPNGDAFVPVDFENESEHFMEQVALFYRDRVVGQGNFFIHQVSFGRPVLACVGGGGEPPRCVWTTVRFGD